MWFSLDTTVNLMEQSLAWQAKQVNKYEQVLE